MVANNWNVVHQKHNENIMDWKEQKRRSDGNDRIQKIPTQNNQEKDNFNFWAYKQNWWTKKANTEWRKSRGRQRTKYTDSLNNFVTRKESRNNEFIMITDDREDWEAMIADVCNRPGTWWWWCTCIWSDGWRTSFLAYFACFHGHNFFDIIYLALYYSISSDGWRTPFLAYFVCFHGYSFFDIIYLVL